MPNQHINKVVLGTEVLLDLTSDTVTPSALMQGYTAHDASGAAITGTATGGDEGSAYQDEDGYIVLGEGESSAPQGNISITANGTYDVADYAGADVDIPVGMSKTDLKNYLQGSNAFTDIDWPDGITRLRAGAFYNCVDFNPSSLPSTLTNIGNRAFYGCSRLALASLPSGITEIGEYSFFGCNKLALTALPSGLTRIHAYAFYQCKTLALTSLPDGVTIIDTYAFYNCSGLSSISLPDTLTRIDSNAFEACTNLTSVSLPSSLTQINSYAFCRCSISTVECDGAITMLGSNAFNTNNSGYPSPITSASFPNMVVSSLSYVFGSSTAEVACHQLEFCDIGSTASIGGSAFANCYKLQTLVLRKTASVCTLGNVSAFLNTPMRGYNGLTGKVYVPSALISSYQTATNWSTLYNDGTVTFVAIEGSEYELD